MDTDPPVAARISFIVRIVPRERGPLTGVVERIGTGAKHRFESVAEMGRIIEQIVADEQADAPARRGGRPCS